MIRIRYNVRRKIKIFMEEENFESMYTYLLLYYFILASKYEKV
jgi:hypothetical protein